MALKEIEERLAGELSDRIHDEPDFLKNAFQFHLSPSPVILRNDKSYNFSSFHILSGIC